MDTTKHCDEHAEHDPACRPCQLAASTYRRPWDTDDETIRTARETGIHPTTLVRGSR